MTQEIENETVSRDFKGIWIPREIWLNKNISTIEKSMWAEIHSLYDREKGGCYASNEYLCKFFGLKERMIRNHLANLKKNGLIKMTSFNGRQRVLQAITPNESLEKSLSVAGQTGKKLPVRDAINCRAPIIYENKEEKIYPSEESLGLSSLFFDHLKAINPKIIKPKDNFKKWADSFDKMIRLDGRSEEEIKQLLAWIKEHHEKATSEFSWGKVIASPEKLRKHFATMWLQMTKLSPETLKKKEEEKKVDFSKENKSWAEVLIKDSTLQDILKFSDNCVFLKEGSSWMPLGFQENGFKEQINNFIRRKKYSL